LTVTTWRTFDIALALAIELILLVVFVV